MRLCSTVLSCFTHVAIVHECNNSGHSCLRKAAYVCWPCRSRFFQLVIQGHRHPDKERVTEMLKSLSAAKGPRYPGICRSGTARKPSSACGSTRVCASCLRCGGEACANHVFCLDVSLLLLLSLKFANVGKSRMPWV